MDIQSYLLGYEAGAIHALKFTKKIIKGVNKKQKNYLKIAKNKLTNIN